MNNIIAEICESSISILEKNLEQIIKTSKVFNLSELTEEMHKITNAIGLRAIKELIEKLGEEIENNPGRLKQGYKIHKKNVKRELITEMGRLVYERTYYRKAEEGYVFLLDELLSVDKYTRV